MAPRLFRLVRCGRCGARFGGRTGRHETDLIPTYQRGVLAGLLLVLAVAAAAWWVLA